MKPLKIKKYGISIRLKIVMVIAFTIVFSFVGYLVSKKTIAKYANIYENEHLADYKQFLKTIFDTQFEKTENVNANLIIDKFENADNISSFPMRKGIDVINFYNSNGEIVRRANPNLIENSFNVDPGLFPAVKKKGSVSYFVLMPKGFVQVIATSLYDSAQKLPNKTHFGYLVVAKMFDEQTLLKLSKNVNCQINIIPFNQPGKNAANIDIGLPSFDGRLVGYIHIEKTNAFIEKLEFLNKKLGNVFILLVLALSLITIISFHVLIIKPLTTIEAALNQQSDIIARKLMYKRDEFGKIARLIIRFFQQSKLLTDKIEKLSETKDKLKFLNKELSLVANDLKVANDEIVLQQKAVNDNIYYASAVQRAALIPSVNVGKVFNDHFILFKPRDVVSGDFYWFYYQNNKYYVAVADCTGHGLSGSLMSMLGISFLNQIVNNANRDLTAAGILAKLREFIVHSLHQQGANIEVYDGMDIGLGIFDFNEMTLEYAAAYNPLYLLRLNNLTKEYDLIVYKGDAMPVGIYEQPSHFHNNRISIKKNDLLYMFTDGIVDQFGGPEDRKFMSKNLRGLLLANAHKKMALQKEIISTAFDDWKGCSFQVDDVTMLGLKI